MYFGLKKDCYFRRYGDIGLLIKPASSVEKVLNNTGATFVERLSREPKSIDAIADELYEMFYQSNITRDEIKKDAEDFYKELVKDNFLFSVDSIENFKEEGFEYSTLNGKLNFLSLNSNLEESSSHFLGEYFKTHPTLETFHIELTSKCNERCIHCYIPHQYKNTDIKPELMKSVLKQCSEMGVLTVIFSGGEPMLHPNFIEFLKYAKDLDLQVTVLSNLTLLTDDIIGALKYKNDSIVNVSLYSMIPEVHDAITTVKGSFYKTKDNIERLIANNIPLQLNCPVMKQNKDSFQDVINWGQNNKCMVVVDLEIMARYDHSTDNLVNRLDADDIKTAIERQLENDVLFQKSIKEGENSTKYDISADDKVCGVGMSTLCMVANGMVYPCAGWQEYHCGDLNKQTLKEIWDSSPEVLYLRKLRMKDFPKCLTCDDRNYCKLCIARNSNESKTGSIFDVPPSTCEAAKLQREIVEKYRKNKKNG